MPLGLCLTSVFQVSNMKLQSIIRERHLSVGSVYDDRSSQSASLTTPDEAMDIPYLLARYVKGLPLDVQHIGVDIPTNNFDSPDWEKARDLDLVDHENLRDELLEIEEAHKEQVKKRKAKKAETISREESPASEPNPKGVVTGSEEGTGSPAQT